MSGYFSRFRLSHLGCSVAFFVGAGAALLAAEPSTPPPGPRLIVVAPRQFGPTLQRYALEKAKLLPSDLRLLEDVLGTYPGVDDAEKLKRFLFEQWRTNSLAYVLLVGDADLMPVRFMVLDRVTPAAFDYAFYPSDLYYADVARGDGSFDDWNSQKSSFHARYFGEVRGEKNKAEAINYDAVHYRPELAVGRWPVSTTGELELVVAKSLAWEQSWPPTERVAAFVAVDGWVDSRAQLSRLADDLPAAWQARKFFYGGDKAFPGSVSPTREQVIGALNRGARLVFHTGHGQADEWEQCFRVADLDQLTNSTNLSVMMSAGCTTAYFCTLPPYQAYLDQEGKEHKGTDNGEVFSSPPPAPACYQRGRFNPTGLGEQALKRNRNGAVAYIGCNTGSQPCALSLVEGFARALSVMDKGESTLRVGDCWKQALNFYFDHERLAELKPDDGWYPPSIFFQGMKFMLFGDPTLRL